MPSHILTVFRPSNPRKKFIAKHVSETSNELEILEIIERGRPKPEHIISLIDSFHVQSGSWIILPNLSDIRYFLEINPERLRDHVVQVCWGLIEGLAYLHKIYIAHRDIKPDNLLVDENFCLKIIDFGVSTQLKNEDEEVSDYCGTKGWIAPEIRREMGAYNPIRADRWSCGLVILHLLGTLKKKNEVLEEKAKKLKTDDPQLRPSLLQWQTWATTQHSSDESGRNEETMSRIRRRLTDASEAHIDIPETKKPRRDGSTD
jgi:serine/threonine protein kinase